VDQAEPGEITQMLAAARSGDGVAWQRLVDAVYADLRRLAHRQLLGPGREQTLNTTGLVHECYLRLASAGSTASDQSHFFALAARVMRQVIIDYARQRLAEKRGGGEHAIALDLVDETEFAQAEEFAALDDALNALALRDERQARVIECRFFAGYSEEETAKALDTSVRTVQREWQQAREWLAEEMNK
jgi:RNA polymerase sigma factor (TIGR02999 family)